MTGQPALRAASDRLLARAIHLALDPAWTIEDAAGELRSMTAGPLVTRHAVVRAHRALEHRPSEVARRVVDVLHAVHDPAERPLLSA